MATITTAQAKHLNARIDAAERMHLYQHRVEKEPAAVARARETMRAWEEKQSKLREKRTNGVKRAAAKAREAVLFSDAGIALGMVQSFEQSDFA